ncbi:MAG: dihydroorotate dehydrogenase [Candidatus Ranarchaeia archaeon]
MSLEIEITGLKLKNPLILASGIIGVTDQLLLKTVKSKAGGVVTKSIGPEPKVGHPGPNIVGVKGGLINAMGLPNPGIERAVEEISNFKKRKLDAPIIASIFGSTTSDFMNLASQVEQAGADAIELNISCPHSEEKVLNIGLDPQLSSTIVSSVKKTTTIPIWVKLPCNTNISTFLDVAEEVEKNGADALVIANTAPSIAIDVSTRKPILGNIVGGFSGEGLKPINLRLVFEAYKKVKIPIIGVGGIESFKDVIEYFLAGSKAIQIGTSIGKYGLQIFETINKDLERYISDNKIDRIQELTGLVY